MLAIIIHHLIYHGKIINKHPKYKNQINLLIILCFWHVNSFGMISGLVGNNKHKFLIYFIHGLLWNFIQYYFIVYLINIMMVNILKIYFTLYIL